MSLRKPESALIFEAYMNSRKPATPGDWKADVIRFRQHYLDTIGNSPKIQKAFQEVLTKATDINSANVLLTKYGCEDFIPFLQNKLND